MKRIILLIICILLNTISIYANEVVSLQWDTNNDADYYIVYWGESSRNYTYNSDNIIAPIREYSTTIIKSGTWYFGVKAFNTCGNSSDFSEEVIKNISLNECPEPSIIKNILIKSVKRL